MSRQFIGSRRRERGFGVNPWATHNRFIVSHPLIRRPEYRDSLLAHLGQRAEKGLLILDEAHVAAPASATKYAVDSDITRAIRDLAPKFDNRLFLSATPHNGHSNSFSALLEILDPIRFVRGVPVEGAEALAPVMVRRLKRDLRQLGVERFPRRILTSISLQHGARGWSATATRFDAEDNTREPPTLLADALDGEPLELQLATQLARYTELCAPASGRGRLVFINLQKRLLSSPEAFARTLEVHAAAVQRAGGVKVRTSPQTDLYADPEVYGVDDETLAAEDDAEVRAASATLPSPSAEATDLLRRMRATAEKARRQPDGKVQALLAWLRAELCPGIGHPGDLPPGRRNWTDRRVIIFTEYGDTKRYLQDLLGEAVTGTDRAAERILVLHGGMGDEARDEVQRAFNCDPAEHPVRILIATDAAREGVNLQAHCADLFHIDVPWNPARLEQRNGRIDRTLQPSPEVRCHYFVYPDRPEDAFLEALVRKIETVQRELGSVGAVLMDEMERTLEPGITAATANRLAAIGADARARTADAELEGQRKNQGRLAAEVHAASQRLEDSRKQLEVSPDALRGVVDIGLAMSSASPLAEAPATAGRRAFLLPTLDHSWQPTLDMLRPPRGPQEAFWEWRKHPPRPVTFEPLDRMGDDVEQLHLAHPFIKRILDRFLAQGFGAHDLSRVAGVVVSGDTVARVLAYARLTLFGPGAARLHDELIAVPAAWPRTSAELAPYKDTATAARARELAERALTGGGRPLPAKVAAQALARASELYAALWPHLQVEADAHGVEARNSLARRARKESEELRALLERQRINIRAARADLSQRVLPTLGDQTQQRQVELDLGHLNDREARIADELVREPRAIEALYAVQMTRLTPIGLVITWPEVMT